MKKEKKQVVVTFKTKPIIFDVEPEQIIKDLFQQKPKRKQK